MNREILFDPIIIERYFKVYREEIEYAIMEGRCSTVTDDTKNKYLKVIYDNLDKLSDRQREVLMMYANGYAQEEMARLLNVTRRTVRNHLKRGLDKMKQIQDVKNIISK